MVELLVDRASHAAALYAVQHWHYSGKLPAGKLFVRGAWEDARFVGVVTLSRGATHRLGAPWGLEQKEIAELSRVALDHSHASPVSQIVAATVRQYRAANPGTRLLISFADPEHGHHGGIYQAGGWIYTGTRDVGPGEFVVRGVRMHSRSVGAKGWRQSLPWLREHVDPNAEQIKPPRKHRYVLPLDRRMARLVREHSEPYPRRAVEGST